MRSTPFHPIPLRSIPILSPTYAYVFKMASFLQIYAIKLCLHFSSLPHTGHLSCMPFSCHLITRWHLVRRTNLLDMQYSPVSFYWIKQIHEERTAYINWTLKDMPQTFAPVFDNFNAYKHNTSQQNEGVIRSISIPVILCLATTVHCLSSMSRKIHEDH